jgi:hypothetical protein
MVAAATSAFTLATSAAADIIPVPASSMQGENLLFNDDKSIGSGMRRRRPKPAIHFT